MLNVILWFIINYITNYSIVKTVKCIFKNSGSNKKSFLVLFNYNWMIRNSPVIKWNKNTKNVDAKLMILTTDYEITQMKQQEQK